MKKTLTKASSKKKSQSTTSKKKPRPISVRLSKKSTDRGTKVIRYIVKKNGELETKEERKKRLAKREALLLRAFQMAYDNHHRK